MTLKFETDTKTHRVCDFNLSILNNKTLIELGDKKHDAEKCALKWKLKLVKQNDVRAMNGNLKWAGMGRNLHADSFLHMMWVRLKLSLVQAQQPIT